MMTVAWVALGLIAAMILLAILGLFVRKDYAWTQADTTVSEAGSLAESYPRRVLVQFDVFWNVVAGGISGETISARCGRWSHRVTAGCGTGWRWLAQFMVRWLDVIQPDHGYEAITGDLARAQRVIDVETAALAKLTAPSQNRP